MGWDGMGWMGSFCLVAFAFFLSFLLSPCFVYSNSSADGIQVSLAVFLLIGLYYTCKLVIYGSEKKKKKDTGESPHEQEDE